MKYNDKRAVEDAEAERKAAEEAGNAKKIAEIAEAAKVETKRKRTRSGFFMCEE